MNPHPDPIMGWNDTPFPEDADTMPSMEYPGKLGDARPPPSIDIADYDLGGMGIGPPSTAGGYDLAPSFPETGVPGALDTGDLWHDTMSLAGDDDRASIMSLGVEPGYGLASLPEEPPGDVGVVPVAGMRPAPEPEHDSLPIKTPSIAPSAARAPTPLRTMSTPIIAAGESLFQAEQPPADGVLAVCPAMKSSDIVAFLHHWLSRTRIHVTATSVHPPCLLLLNLIANGHMADDTTFADVVRELNAVRPLPTIASRLSHQGAKIFPVESAMDDRSIRHQHSVETIICRVVAALRQGACSREELVNRTKFERRRLSSALGPYKGSQLLYEVEMTARAGIKLGRNFRLEGITFHVGEYVRYFLRLVEVANLMEAEATRLAESLELSIMIPQVPKRAHIAISADQQRAAATQYEEDDSYAGDSSSQYYPLMDAMRDQANRMVTFM